MKIKFLKEVICVYFWCQHVHNYWYGDDKRDGIIWPYILTSSLLGIFFYGVYFCVWALFDSAGELDFWFAYPISLLLGAYVTNVVCIENSSFKRGEEYFESVEKHAKRSSAMNFSFVFTLICFSPRLLCLLSLSLWGIWSQ